MAKHVAGKAAIVAGGSAGIGLAVVEKLVERGYRVGVIARGQGRLDELAARFGDKVAVAAADVSDAGALGAAVEGIVATIGVPEIWVNSAMLTSFSQFEDVGPEEFEAITDTTYHGQVNGTRIAMTHMPRGKIVNIGSGLAYTPVPGQAAYCGAKHAINGFTGSVRAELMANRPDLTIHLVQLPAVNTPQFSWARNRMDKHPQPAPPIFQPWLAADAVMQAIDTGARELFVGKSVLQLVFGNMVLPGFVDGKMADDGIAMQKDDAPQPGFRAGNLESPAERPATAEGDFSDRAEEDGTILDADKARKAVFFGVPAALFVLGLVIGLILG
ncbi:MAG: SDR family oxidoreductase [Shimia sp.]